jgi:hypothetical protein
MVHNGEKISTGNLILHGVKGVGKTTLLQAASIFAWFELDMLAVAWNYEGQADPTHPYRLIPYALELARPDTPLSRTESYVRQAIDRKLQGIILLLDEINDIFDPQVSPAVNLDIMSYLLELSKSRRYGIILTGSSSRLRQLLFHCPSKSLNSTVFGFVNVTPVREVSSLSKFIARRFPSQRHHHHVATIFALTGGVGRKVDLYFSGRLDLLSTVVVKLQEDPVFLHFATLMWLQNQTNVKAGDPGNPSSLNDTVAIPSIRSNILGEKLQGCLEQFQDDSLVLCMGDIVQLLVPQDLCLIHDYLHRDVAAVCQLGMRVTLKGWEGYGSAGAAAEPYVFYYIVRPLLKVIYDFAAPYEIRVRGSRAILLQNQADVSLISVPAIYNVLIQVSQDTGVDGVFLRPIHESQGDVGIHFLQVKLGAFGKTITEGNLTTQRNNLKKNASRVDDATIAGIIVKAERGMKAVYDYLKQLFPRVNFIPLEIYLVTNKAINANGCAMVAREQVRCDWHRGQSARLSAISKEEFERAMPSDFLHSLV